MSASVKPKDCLKIAVISAPFKTSWYACIASKFPFDGYTGAVPINAKMRETVDEGTSLKVL